MSETSKTNLVQTAGVPQTSEQRFTILPHPARSNNPADLVGSGAGLTSNPAVLAHHAREPHIPSQDVLNKLDAPLSREELRKRSEELNK